MDCQIRVSSKPNRIRENNNTRYSFSRIGVCPVRIFICINQTGAATSSPRKNSIHPQITLFGHGKAFVHSSLLQSDATMQESKDVKWILAISLVMFFLLVYLVPSLIYIGPTYLYVPAPRTTADMFWYYVNRVDMLLFIATITTATLFAAGYGKYQLVHRLTISFFLVAMGFFFLSFVRLLTTAP